MEKPTVGYVLEKLEDPGWHDVERGKLVPATVRLLTTEVQATVNDEFIKLCQPQDGLWKTNQEVLEEFEALLKGHIEFELSEDGAKMRATEGLDPLTLGTEVVV